MGNKILKLAGNAFIAVLVLVMVVLVFFTVGSKISPDGLPKLADYRLMVVLSGSMSPVFEAGDVIAVSGQKKQTEYQKGDVITFKDPEDTKRIVTHRVAEVVKDDTGVSYRTKGDANGSIDSKPVPADNVIGQQTIRIPYFGRVVEFAKTKQGLVWLIIVPGVLIIVSELRSIGKAITGEVEKKKQEAVAEPWSKE
ncbi:signal peptidase I [Phosphitispora fastidiosa]|uniref:signal peptidase I n=1 Tax=Phosphitispora fastidiosa TaxID=2837202 RepID=UPI001E31AF16|nr:signal peptidase [Phosphitispora fastidiosa]